MMDSAKKMGRARIRGAVVGGQIRVGGRVEAPGQYPNAKVSERGVPQLVLEGSREFESLCAPRAGQIGIGITVHHRTEVRHTPWPHADSAIPWPPPYAWDGVHIPGMYTESAL